MRIIDWSSVVCSSDLLIDPVDPSSIFPEALALKRQCITHGRPFISTLAGAIEWMEVERLHAGLAPDVSVARLFDFSQQPLAPIWHDRSEESRVGKEWVRTVNIPLLR